MAIQRGSIKIDNKIVGYFQFSRVVNMAQTRIYITSEDVMNNWRTHDHARECTCSSKPVVAELNSGNELFRGHVWQSKVCLSCCAIVGSPDPTDTTRDFLSQYYSDDYIAELKRKWGWTD